MDYLSAVTHVWEMEVHIGEKIKARAKELKVGSTELGRLINTSKQNIYGIYKRKSVDTEILLQLSKVLRFNFFKFYELPEIGFHDVAAKALQNAKEEIVRQKQEITELKEKNELLKKINKLLESKRK